VRVLQSSRALTDDTNRIRLHEVVKIAGQALADMRRATERYKRSENTSKQGDP